MKCHYVICHINDTDILSYPQIMEVGGRYVSGKYFLFLRGASNEYPQHVSKES